MKGKKYLAKNIGILTLSQFGTKLLSFFLVPLYTSVLSTAEYGIYDLYSTTVALFIPILTANIADAVLRFLLDLHSNKNDIIKISFHYYFISIIVCIFIILINHFCRFFLIFDQYSLFFFAIFASNALSGILINISRGMEKIKFVAISGVICSAIMLSLNILFLIPLKMGLYGYFLANFLGALSQSIYLFLSLKIWRYIRFGKLEKLLQRDMVNYSKPLMINNISWWISSASDRYIVTFFEGIAINGIYSVGYKIPSILNIFQNIFNQAWTLSAVQDYDAEDKSGFFSGIYNIYNFCTVIACSILIASTKIAAYFLYARDFFAAWKYVPFLLIAIVFGALSGYIGGIFAAVKNSGIFAKTSFYGALVNLILNIILVKMVGSVGAAISTMISYFIIWISRIHYVKKYIQIQFNIARDFISYLILLLQSIVLFIFDKYNILMYLFELLLFLLLILIYIKEFGELLKFLKLKRGKAKGV